MAEYHSREKGSRLEDAVRYSLNQKPRLTAFLNDGEIPISNNMAENTIRPFTLGRKDWVPCDMVKGAESSAIVYSLFESAKANGVEPFAYLQHVFCNCLTWEKLIHTRNWIP